MDAIVPVGYHRLLQKAEPMAYGGKRVETICVSAVTTFILSLGMSVSRNHLVTTLHSSLGVSNGVHIDWHIDDDSKKGFRWY